MPVGWNCTNSMSCSGQAGAQRHAAAIARAGVGGGGGEVGAAIAAGREDHALGAEAVQRAVVELERGDAAAGAVFHDEVEREVFDEEVDGVLQRLAVERVEHGVAGAVGRGAGALDRGFAIVLGHAAEGALVDLAFLGAREGDAPVLEFVDGGGGGADHVFDRVLVAEPVGALHRVVHVPAPVILAHVSERGGDAALRRDRVRAGGEDFRDAGGLQAGLGATERGAKAGAAGADDHDVIGVIVPGVRSSHVGSPWKRNSWIRRWRSSAPRRRRRRRGRRR